MAITYLDKPKITYLDNAPKELKSIYPKVPESDVLMNTIQGTGKDILAPVAHYANQFLLNTPRAITEKLGYEYPSETTSPTAGVIAKGAGVIGALQSPINKIIPGGGGITSLLKGQSAKAGLLAKDIASGAIIGGAYSPKDPLDIKSRLGQAAGGAVLGGALPVAARGIQEVIPMGGKIGRALSGISSEAVKWVKQRGTNTVFNPIKQKVDFVKTDLAPKVDMVFKRNLANFTPEIQNFAEKSLKISKQAINTIKTKGVENLQKFRQSVNDSSDFIYQKIKSGLENKKLQADEMYRTALENYNDPINADGFYRSLKNVLLREKYIDLTGKPTTNAKNSAMVKLRNEYLNMGQSKNYIMDKTDFLQYRDFLGGLLRESPADRSIMEIRNALYGSAEKSGVKGIQAARNLENKAFEVEKTHPESLFSEQRLDKFHSLSEATVRKLKEIEDYIGVPFLDDVNNLVSARELDKFSKFDINSISQLLTSATNPKNLESVRRQLTEIFGAKVSTNVVNQIKDHLVATMFDPSSITQGEAIWASRPGFIKKAAKGLMKGYYEKAYPELMKAKQNIQGVQQKINPLGRFLKPL